MDRWTIVGEKGIQGKPQDTSLRNTSFQGEGGGCMFFLNWESGGRALTVVCCE